MRRKRIILSLCICLLWCATAYAYEEEFPTRTTFSVGWTQWAKQLAAGMKTTGDAALSLSKSQGMDAEQLSSLQAVLEQLDIGFHLQYGEADAGLQGVDFSLAQTPWISLVQAQQEGLIGVRVSTLPEVWLTLPAEAGATRDQAGARLTDVLGMEIDWLPSLGAYFEKPLSSAPRPWQIFDAQWRAFQCLCTDYADEGAENRGLSGMDAQSHGYGGATGSAWRMACGVQNRRDGAGTAVYAVRRATRRRAVMVERTDGKSADMESAQSHAATRILGRRG
ncbi:MAG: hypothetical protein RR482_00685 [Clostridia bacterium]